MNARELHVEFGVGLVEEAVFLAVESGPVEYRRAFRAERDPVYEVPDADDREAAFNDLHAGWFGRLRLGEAVLAALTEWPDLGRSTAQCVVLPAAGAKDEGADLHDPREPAEKDGATKPVLIVRLRPRTLLDAHGLTRLLRSELMHVADILDPDFLYEKELTTGEADPSYQKLMRDRYRVIWDTTVDGRLAARGLLPPGGEERRRGEFAAAFSMLGEEAEKRFERLFRGPRPSHPEILALAGDPARDLGTNGLRGGKRGRCPICKFPTARLLEAGDLDRAVVAQIRVEAGSWRPEEGICLQCTDLYASRPGTGATRGMISRLPT
jgi:hypothetical protein